MVRLAVGLRDYALEFAFDRLQADPALQVLAQQTTEKQKKVPRRGDLLPLLSQLAADERGDLTRF